MLIHALHSLNTIAEEPVSNNHFDENFMEFVMFNCTLTAGENRIDYLNIPLP
jgi:hypothetical protein